MSSFYITILSLGFIAGVCMETCPEPEDIYPCSCKEERTGLGTEIKVDCSSDLFQKLHGLDERLPLKLLQQALNSLQGKNVRHLILKDIKSTLPSNVFSAIRIKLLDFRSCRLDGLTKDDQPGLLGLENHLEGLVIFNSSFVPAKFNLGHLKKLRTIGLSGNSIPELGDNWLSNVPLSLESINIYKNNITMIGISAFSRLNNLVTLWLEDNKLGLIKRSMFPTTAERLRSLNLKNNSLTDLPLDLFSMMPSIQWVYLDSNGITTLDERTWSPIWQQLAVLSLKGNNIICDNRLNWIIKLKRRPVIFAECSAPKHFKGISLDKFFKSQS